MKIRNVLVVLILAAGLMDSHEMALASDPSKELETGMNIVNPLRATIEAQNAVIAQLKAANVHVVRAGNLVNDDKSLDFIKRIYAQGMKLDLIINPQYPANAPTRPFKPEFPNVWAGHPLSSADVELSRAFFKSFFAKLDADHIELAAIELGNEINWAPFNAEFPVPGKGKNFSLNDLSDDPEAKQIAKGFLRYLNVLAVLKEVRDHSQVNQRTLLVTAGLADDGPEGPWGNKVDGVSVSATLQFMRAHGLDKYVDAYAVHTYPWGRDSADRRKRMEKTALAECRAPQSGKPCYITEWGIRNKNMSCPADDSQRLPIVKDLMNDFREIHRQGRLLGILYFSWNSDPWAKTINDASVYRCDSLMPSGKAAL